MLNYVPSHMSDDMLFFIALTVAMGLIVQEDLSDYLSTHPVIIYYHILCQCNAKGQIFEHVLPTMTDFFFTIIYIPHCPTPPPPHI